jgi:hypothetical protein
VFGEGPAYLRTQAQKCRNLARTTLDQRVEETLLGMAEEYEQKAEQLLAREPKDV